jgi:hypothetical protein
LTVPQSARQIEVTLPERSEAEAGPDGKRPFRWRGALGGGLFRSGLEAADELAIDPSDRIAVRRFDEGPRLAAGIFAVALDDDDQAVLDRANDVRITVAHVERRAPRVGDTAALGGEGRRNGEGGAKSDG